MYQLLTIIGKVLYNAVPLLSLHLVSKDQLCPPYGTVQDAHPDQAAVLGLSERVPLYSAPVVAGLFHTSRTSKSDIGRRC